MAEYRRTGVLSWIFRCGQCGAWHSHHDAMVATRMSDGNVYATFTGRNRR